VKQNLSGVRPLGGKESKKNFKLMGLLCILKQRGSILSMKFFAKLSFKKAEKEVI
jgi:hypothetical protein